MFDNISVSVDYSPTLPVELSSFTAAISNDNKVNIMWTTESETNSLGFQVYRGTESNLEAARLISPLISATNTSQTQSYIFRDGELTQSGTYYYWLESLDLDGQTDFHGPTALDVSLQQGSATPSIPLVEGISSIYPNPFNPSTGIKFCLEKEDNARILIYNARGQIVRTLLDQRMPSGYHRETWDGTNELGQACGSGIYLIRLVVGERSFTSKAVLLK
ncbi:MAG: T9SS type A sorting domain-containing protein [Candidatus Cloacimonetes bacterium]|nr:T9SS type A sorting domain-containing protein [Candidatus Cloacimonadota bacterium]